MRQRFEVQDYHESDNIQIYTGIHRKVGRRMPTEHLGNSLTSWPSIRRKPSANDWREATPNMSKVPHSLDVCSIRTVYDGRENTSRLY